MTDFKVTVAPMKPLETFKDSFATTIKSESQTTKDATPEKAGKTHDLAVLAAANYEMNFHVDSDGKNRALHLQIKTTDGEVIREIVMSKFDAGIMDVSKLKGVLIDDRS